MPNMHAKTASSVGMMEGAFFVGRHQLLSWVNGLLAVDVKNVEQCANGAIYCQIIDSIHPQHISMKKVNWMAKCDHEFIPNYKVLQLAFNNLGIDKHIEVDRLIRAKYQDNLEFLQWMKHYWELERKTPAGAALIAYDPTNARAGKSLPIWAQNGTFDRSVLQGGGDNYLIGQKENSGPRPNSAVDKRPTSGKTGFPQQKQMASTARPFARAQPRQADREPRALSTNSRGDPEEAKRALKQELEDLREAFDGVEVERDYYFEKLRDVEVLCCNTQVPENVEFADFIEKVQKILYAPHAADEQREETAGHAAQQDSVGEAECL